MPPGLDAHDVLTITSPVDTIGLAVRGPGCLAGDELDCAAPSTSGATVTVPQPAVLQAAGVAPFLFVELPDPGVLGEPLVLQVQRMRAVAPLASQFDWL